jgi:PKD repeat protein
MPITEEGAAVDIAGLGESWATERMIVRTAEMSLVVNDVSIALDRIAKLAEDSDGYVVSSTIWKENERLFGVISIRVPADDFNTVMGALRGMAVDVTHEDTSSQDVTEEYVDLSAKLNNLEATEEQLLQIMEKATRVEDVLEVQRELSRTRGEIEQVKGRMQYLERTSATSLIRVQLNQAAIDVNFAADKRTVKEGQTIRFEDRISGGFAPYSYEWDFGDGETSTIQNPTHSYKTVGNYTVTLKVTDDRGNIDTQARTDYIEVIPGWSAGSIASGAWSGLVIFGQILANIFIWLGVFSPVWIVIGGVVFWIYRRRRKKAQG